MLNNPPTILTISNHGRKFTAELHWDSSLDDCFEAFLGLMVTAGYSLDGLKEHIADKADEYEVDKKERENEDRESND